MKLKCRQQNQGTKNLPPLQAGDAVCMGLPGEQKWNLGPVPLADASKETDASRCMPEQLPQNYTEVTPEKTQAEKHAHDQDPVTPTDVNDTPQTLVGLEGNDSPPALAGLEGNMETLPSPEVNFFFSFTLFFSKKSLL